MVLLNTSSLPFYLCIEFIEISPCFSLYLCDFLVHFTLITTTYGYFALVKTKITYMKISYLFVSFIVWTVELYFLHISPYSPDFLCEIWI